MAGLWRTNMLPGKLLVTYLEDCEGLDCKKAGYQRVEHPPPPDSLGLGNVKMFFVEYCTIRFMKAVVAERLRRLTRNQIPFRSAGSKPANCVYFNFVSFSKSCSHSSQYCNGVMPVYCTAL